MARVVFTILITKEFVTIRHHKLMYEGTRIIHTKSMRPGIIKQPIIPIALYIAAEKAKPIKNPIAISIPAAIRFLGSFSLQDP